MHRLKTRRRVGGPVVALYTQADLDALTGVLDREAANLATAFAASTAYASPEYEPSQEAWRAWTADYATWRLNPQGLLLGSRYLAGQALIPRAQELEKRIAALGSPVPFHVEPPTPAFSFSSALSDVPVWVWGLVLWAFSQRSR